jgi:hypothetical protein
MTWLGLVALLALLLTASPAPVSAQGSGGRGGAVTQMKPTFGCWICTTVMGFGVCNGGVPGYWNCTTNWSSTCGLSSPGCGAGAMLPLDLDGASQYVSRGSAIGLSRELGEGGGPPIQRNCEGVVVARYQAPDNIASVRSRTGTLAL